MELTLLAFRRAHLHHLTIRIIHESIVQYYTKYHKYEFLLNKITTTLNAIIQGRRKLNSVFYVSRNSF